MVNLSAADKELMGALLQARSSVLLGLLDVLDGRPLPVAQREAITRAAGSRGGSIGKHGARRVPRSSG